MSKKDRTGEIRVSNEGYEMKIVEYNKNTDIWVEFQDEHKARVHTSYQKFKDGGVKNPYHPSVFGVGYIGEGKYSKKDHEEYYKTWYDMHERGNSAKFKLKYPTYADVSVSEEFYCFQDYCKWCEEGNYYKIAGETMDLDKDILCKGNKVYSPETCIFVPHAINGLFVKSDASRGKYPIGCYYNKGKIKVQCNIFNTETGESKQEYLGLFPKTEEGIMQAFETYKKAKENNIKVVANYYRMHIPNILYEALMNYEVDIND